MRAMCRMAIEAIKRRRRMQAAAIDVLRHVANDAEPRGQLGRAWTLLLLAHVTTVQK